MAEYTRQGDVIEETPVILIAGVKGAFELMGWFGEAKTV